MLHRIVEDNIEELLTGTPVPAAQTHLDACAECREMLSGLGRQSRWIRTLKAPHDGVDGFDPEPSPGFYARVMERIEAEGPISVWNLFIESAFGRRIAVASLALAMLLGVYLVSVERGDSEQVIAVRPQIQYVLPDDGVPSFVVPGVVPGAVHSVVDLGPLSSDFDEAKQQANQDAVLVDLATYREQ
jgi:hypothetical protein